MKSNFFFLISLYEIKLQDSHEQYQLEFEIKFNTVYTYM